LDGGGVGDLGHHLENGVPGFSLEIVFGVFHQMS
jgi:hypothetical protein